MPVKIATISFAVCLATGCSTHVSLRELFGTYRAENTERHSILILRADMTYLRTNTYKDTGRVEKVSGKWALDPYGLGLTDACLVTE